jgi:hypothetical protein
MPSSARGRAGEDVALTDQELVVTYRTSTKKENCSPTRCVQKLHTS